MPTGACTARANMRSAGLSAGRGRSAAAFVLFVLVFLTVVASGPDAYANPRYAGLVIDAVTGEVFYEENANRQLHPASLTKIMTLYLTFQALERGTLQLDQALPVSATANAQPPSRVDVPTGGTIRVEDAIYALVTKSANNISVVLAEAMSGSETAFAERMTQQARQLGMVRTVFRNASGLPDRAQLSTAYDMAVLAQALLRDYPQYYAYFSTTRWTYRGVTYRNHNRLLSRYEGMDGIKTGYIRASGFNLVGSAERDRLRLIAVVFGGRTAARRNAHLSNLLDRAFASERGRFLIAHGSLPFEPPLPPRLPTSRALTPTAVAQYAQPPGSAGVTPSSSASLQAQRPQQRTPVALRPTGPPLPLVPSAAGQHEIGGDAPQADAVNEPSGWAVQVGAFSSERDGRVALDSATAIVPDLLTPAMPVVLPLDTGTGTLYRARLYGLDSETAAAACARLVASGGDCMTVAPDGRL